jgi:preprotein translocase subunit YajC
VRKLASFLFLIVLAIAVWLGARWFVHRDEVKATIVFNDAHGLRRGDPVVENGATVGRVVAIDKVDERTAVTIRLDRDHRRSIVSDSLFAVDHQSLVVTNTFAVGAPIDDGAVIRVKEDGVSRWLAKHAGAVKPYLDAARAKADSFLDRDFDEWTKKVPEWKREGSAAFDKHLEEAKKRVEKTKTDLRNSNKAAEARKLEEKFEKWLAEVKR